MSYAIGVDAGGTHLRVALVGPTGNIVRREQRTVGQARDPKPFFELLAELIRTVGGSHLSDLAGIGVGLPGICNPKEKVIHQLPHYPSWKDVPVTALLQRHFNCPILFDNDANMAAVGEQSFGAGRKWSSFIMLTLGTGIGGGLIFDGKLWQGEEGFAGEVGHMVIDPNGRLCACGQKGCWEMYAASGAVPKGKTALALHEEAARGEIAAGAFWREFGRYLGLGILNLAHITGVHHFVIGGGICGAFKHFIGAARATTARGSYQKMNERMEIVPAALQGDAALIGASIRARGFIGLRSAFGGAARPE